ncbi:MAG: nitrile hydratase subunit beta [Burkholderiaceae bacterium]|nr:nitrile hydratase subunit beta [Burkholderiaceae bacterium]
MSYTSHADLGGTPNATPVLPEPEGELWHAPWEPRALAVTLAMGATGAWNIDQSRSARETLPDYASLSYYQVWIAALEQLLAQRGLATADELAAGRALHAAPPLPRRLAAADVAAALAQGSPTTRPATSVARYAMGDVVRLQAVAPDHHSRVPGYVRGKTGRIALCHGAHAFADSRARGLGDDAQWLYTVVFDGATLWGEAATPGLSVSIDAWESTLEPA